MPHIPNMKEKTLRYPGHVEYIKVLKESGFFGSEKIELNGNMISPLDFTKNALPLIRKIRCFDVSSTTSNLSFRNSVRSKFSFSAALLRNCLVSFSLR